MVQRCWYAGPRQFQPLDYLRLFPSQRDAEEAAYHSAHAWSKHHRPDEEPQVKTLLLPSYPAHNQTGSSYGFIAHGSLFWVRSLMAHVSPESLNEAFAVLTEGVIGGTGNRNSRRGTEVPTGRVFVGAHMRMDALQVCHRVMSQLGSQCSTSVVTLPIGKPQDYQTQAFLADWPPQVLQPNLLQPTTNHNKRESSSHTWMHEDHPGVEVECPFSLPPAAKRRRCFKTMENTLWWLGQTTKCRRDFGSPFC